LGYCRREKYRFSFRAVPLASSLNKWSSGNSSSDLYRQTLADEMLDINPAKSVSCSPCLVPLRITPRNYGEPSRSVHSFILLICIRRSVALITLAAESRSANKFLSPSSSCFPRISPNATRPWYSFPSREKYPIVSPFRRGSQWATRSRHGKREFRQREYRRWREEGGGHRTKGYVCGLKIREREFWLRSVRMKIASALRRCCRNFPKFLTVIVTWP